MSDAVIKIGAIVDTDEIKRGTEANVQAIAEGNKKISISFQEVQSISTAAFRKISADVKEATSSISAETRRAAESARELKLAEDDLRNAYKLRGSTQLETAQIDSLIGAAQDRVRLATVANTEAQKAFAAAEREVATASHSAVSGVQATSAAIRSLEGNAGIRAVENFVAKTLGLGPLMQNLFPLIGGLAFAKILFDIGEKIFDVGQKAANASKEITKASAEEHDKAQIRIDDLQIENDKLDDQLAKLAGHPTNGMVTALDEGRKMADQLLVSLTEDRKALDALLADKQVGLFGTALTGVASTGRQYKEIQGDQGDLTKSVREANRNREAEIGESQDEAVIKTATDHYNVAVRKAFDDKIATYQKELGRLDQVQKTANDRAHSLAAIANPALGQSAAPPEDYSARRANVQAFIDKLQERKKLEELEVARSSKQGAVGAARQAKAEEPSDPKSGGANKAAELELKAMEAHVAEWHKLAPVTATALYDYWEQQLQAFAVGSQQYNTVVEKQSQIAVSGAQKASAAIERFKATTKRESAADPAEQERVERSIEAVNKVVREQGEDVSHTGERWDSYNAGVTRGREIAASFAATQAEAQIRLREQYQGLSAVSAAEELAAIHTQQHARALQALREELAALEAEGAKLKPGAAGYEQNQTRQVNVRNQITQQEDTGKTQGGKDQQAIADAMAKPYLNAFGQINSGWLRVQSELIQGNANIGRSFARMGLQLVQSAATAAEQSLAKHVTAAIRQAAVHRAMVAQQIATDATGAAAGEAIAKSTTAVQGLAAAKLAFKHTYAVVSGWPVIGPFVAPVAAAGAFAAVAAFEEGTQFVPRVGMAVLHPGEAVLGSPSAQVMRDALQGRLAGGGGGGDVHVNVGGNHFAGGGGDLPSQLEAHERHFVKTINRLHREGKLKLPR